MNAETFAPILFELLAKSTLVLAAAALIDRSWSRASAAQRHLIWCAALSTLLVLPLTRGFEPRWTVPLQRVTVELPTPSQLELPPIASVPASGLKVIPTAAAPRWRAPGWKSVVLWTWSVGASVLLARRLLGSLRLTWLKRTTLPLVDARTQNLAGGIFRELGVRRRVDLRLSPAGCVPLTWGSLRPVLTLPAEALGWKDGALEAALRHEAGHIARGDHLTRWLAQLACVFYWPNPLVWFAARRLRVAQEEATDDLVLRAGTAPGEYAAQLFDVARTLATRHRHTRHAVAMASPSTLERRILAIVDDRRDRRPLSLRALLGTFLAAALTLGLSTAAQLQAEEKKPAGASGGTKFGPQQIMIEAKFVELTVEARAKLVSPLLPLFSPTFPDSQTPEAVKGAMMLTGVLTEAQSGEVIRGLSQQRGVDLLSAPRVTTKSGQRAVVEIIREFRYPTEYEKEGKVWKPKEFETRNVGVTFQVEAVVGPDGSTIDLELAPSVVEFLGWNDLDTGRKYPVVGAQDPIAEVPGGHRAQPVFSERKIITSVSIFDGQTVVLGTTGEVVANKDFPTKQPPRQLTIFVTAKILDKASRTNLVEPAPKPATPAPGAADAVAAIMLPWIELRDATLSEAVASLLSQARANGAPAVNILVPNPATPEPVMSLSLVNVSLPEALRYVASLAGRQVRRDGNVFYLETQPDAADPGLGKGIRGNITVSEPESAALEKARSIILPKVEFKEATVEEVVEFLRKRSAEFDPESDPAKRGLKIILLDRPADLSTAKITLSLTNIPVNEALRYLAGLGGLEIAAEPNALILRAPKKSASAVLAVSPPAAEMPTEPPVAKWVAGKPGYITSPYAPTAGYIDVTGFAPGTEVQCPYSGKRFRVPSAPTESAPVLITKVWRIEGEHLRRALGTDASNEALKAALIKRQVAFPEGSTLVWGQGGLMIIMRNTEDNIQRLETLIQKAVGQ